MTMARFKLGDRVALNDVPHAWPLYEIVGVLGAGRFVVRGIAHPRGRRVHDAALKLVRRKGGMPRKGHSAPR
jgi:hypothetical protein